MAPYDEDYNDNDEDEDDNGDERKEVSKRIIEAGIATETTCTEV